MAAPKRILCPVDFRELSTRALAYAGTIAKWYRSELTALHVAPALEPVEVLRAGELFDPVRFASPRTREQVERQLREAMHDADLAATRARAVAEAGDPSEVIVRQSVKTKADLVVMATHGRSGWNRLMLGSGAEKVLRTVPCPVLTVPPHAPPSPARAAMKTVLCAVDESPAALRGDGLAVDFARRARASVTFLRVVEWLAGEEPREIAHFSVPEIRGYRIQDAKERLKELIPGQPRIARGAVATVAVGRAYREILRIASEIGADLIVMGAQGRGGPPLTPLGSTTQQVVRAAACPVLRVNAPGRKAKP